MHPLQSYKKAEESRPKILPLSSRRLSPPTFLHETPSKNTCSMLLALVRRASVVAVSFFAFFSFFSWSHQRLRPRTVSRRVRMSFRVHCYATYTIFHIYIYIYIYTHTLVLKRMLNLNIDVDINAVECQQNDIINKRTISHLEVRRPCLMQADGPGLHWRTP